MAEIELRDYLAGQALVVLPLTQTTTEDISRLAYEMADAMLEARRPLTEITPKHKEENQCPS